MHIQDLIEEARQKALAPRRPTQCRVCQCEIPVEKRQGPPRLTCKTCALFQMTASRPLPRHCEHCRTEFWPERDAARFCSDQCRRQSDKERRRLIYRNETCCGCGEVIAAAAHILALNSRQARRLLKQLQLGGLADHEDFTVPTAKRVPCIAKISSNTPVPLISSTARETLSNIA